MTELLIEVVVLILCAIGALMLPGFVSRVVASGWRAGRDGEGGLAEQVDLWRTWVGTDVAVKTRACPTDLYVGKLTEMSDRHLRMEMENGMDIILIVRPTELLAMAQVAQPKVDPSAALMKLLTNGAGGANATHH